MYSLVIVGELVALARGTGRQQESYKGRQPKQGRKLAHSDRVFHHIAEGTSKRVPAANNANSAAEKAIPLGGDDDKLEHFNT